MKPVKRALISVSDKTGIAELGAGLAALGIEILATGGTARHLQDAGVNIVEVANYTGFPEMLGGRVKTLHPKIHAGILARRSGPAEAEDEDELAANDIGTIDLVVINLYPFAQTIAKAGTSLAEAIEQIDIGGPAMLRSAAKNHDGVAVIVDSADYARLLAELKRPERVPDALWRRQLAAKTFQHTAGYDGAIANYLGGLDEAGQTSKEPGLYLNIQLERAQPLRYGENPHQQAALYSTVPPSGLAAVQQLQGRPLSYNNINDAETAWRCAFSFTDPTCVIVKHANPCGVSSAANAKMAYTHAYQTDPTSAFGGIIAFNCTINAELLTQIVATQFAEVIIAPKVSGDYSTALAKRKNMRLLISPPPETLSGQLQMLSITGGALVQEPDLPLFPDGDLKVVSSRKPTEAERVGLLFAWTVAKFVKSNAMVLVAGTRTIGIGAGQMSRIYSTRIAAIKASDESLETIGTVIASDAFLPFRDGLDEAAAVGVTALIQPGGSVRDPEVIAAADEAGMAMLFTNMRHFRH